MGKGMPQTYLVAKSTMFVLVVVNKLATENTVVSSRKRTLQNKLKFYPQRNALKKDISSDLQYLNYISKVSFTTKCKKHIHI